MNNAFSKKIPFALMAVFASHCTQFKLKAGTRDEALREPSAAKCRPTRVVEIGKSKNVPICVLGGDPQSFTPTESAKTVTDAENFDVIVVGAGLSGLSSAVYLSDQNLKVLILEKEMRVGGLASAGVDEEDDVVYDRGAAYFTKPYREEYEIINHIELGKYKEHAIREPIDSYFWNGTLYSEIWSPETIKKLPASFDVFRLALIAADEGKKIPNQPFEEFEKVGGSMVLDQITTVAWIRKMPAELALLKSPDAKRALRSFNKEIKEGKLDSKDPMKDVLGLIDLYCRSALGTTSDRVSAMAFANFYISEIDTRYTTPIGTGKAAQNMEKMLRERSSLVTISTQSPVLSIDNAEAKGPNEFVTVKYNRKDGNAIATHSVKAHYVVFAAQLGLAPKLITGFKEKNPNGQAALMSSLEYAHYSVHNIKVKGHPWRAAYDTWTRARDYSENDFTDFILGRWMELDGYSGFRDFKKDPPDDAIFSIYHPLPSSWIGKEYSRDQAAGLAEKASQRLVSLYSDQFKKMDLTGVASNTEIDTLSIKTSRWPFSVHIATPGYYSSHQDGGKTLPARAKVLRAPYGRVFFANNNLGTPAFEEALFRGHCAANNILKRENSRFENESWSRCPLD